jgi:nitroimidazol reductase NimA-like FMN-containing flavoprotein (pyridoxamine 5'-phosphate oxidase superfamily)
MTGTYSWFRGELRELDPEECWELLRCKRVGRIAYCGPDGPEVLPMNYVVAGDSVLFRTAPSTALGHHLRLDTAVFQVDEVDDYTESGWSVMLRGTVDPVEGQDLTGIDQRPEPWAAGPRPLHLRLSPRTVTGRRLLPG